MLLCDIAVIYVDDFIWLFYLVSLASCMYIRDVTEYKYIFWIWTDYVLFTDILMFVQ